MEWKELSGLITITLLFATSVAVCQVPPEPFPLNDNCPVKVTGPTAKFDLEHDRDTDGGGSLFCTLGITASQAIRAISDFKLAVAVPDRLPAGTILKFPIEVVVYGKWRDGKRKDSRLMLHTRAEWVEFVRHKLNNKQRRAIEAAKLSDMTMVNSWGAGPGFILGDGLVFFSTRNPKHITVWHLNTEVIGD